jgi:hypothetical protein
MPHIMEAQINKNISWKIIVNTIKRINNVVTLNEIVKRMLHLGWSEAVTEEIIEEMAAENVLEIRYGRKNDYIVL